MIAVFDPLDANRWREMVARDLIGAAERIAGALHDQRGGAQMLEMRDAGARGITGWMERIAEADKPRDSDFIGNHARDPAAHRLASDYYPGRIAESRDHIAP